MDTSQQPSLRDKLLTAGKIATIEILPNAALISYEADGLKVCKTSKLESLIKSFQNTDTKIVTPILPTSCIRYEEKGNNIVVRLLHEQTTFTATCFGKTYEGVLRPNCVMSFILSKRDEVFTIQDTSCFAIVDDPMLINANTQLYGMPFPNISNNGWVCWGSNSIAGNFRSLTGLKVYIDRLFKAPFNDHLFNTNFLRNFGIEKPEDLFVYLQGKTRFPNEILENLGRGYTLGSI